MPSYDLPSPVSSALGAKGVAASIPGLTRRALGKLILPAAITLGSGGHRAAAADRPMFAATRLSWPTAVTKLAKAGKNAVITRIACGAPNYNTYDLQLFFPAMYTSPRAATIESHPVDPVPIQGVAIEYQGRFYPVTFGRAASVILTRANGPGVLSDPVANLALPPNAQYFVRTVTCHALNQEYIAGLRPHRHNGEARACASSGDALSPLLASGTVIDDPDGPPFLYGPAYAVAKGWDGRPVFLFTGDSVGWGGPDVGATTDARGNCGYLARGCDDLLASRRCPYGTICAPAMGPSQADLANSGLRFAGIAAAGQPFTHIIDQLGNNGIRGPNLNYEVGVWNPMVAWQQRLDIQYPGVPRAKTTFFPRVRATTDDFTSLAGQSPNPDGGDDYPDGCRYRLIYDIRIFRGNHWQWVVDVLPHGMDPNVPGVWRIQDFTTRLSANLAAGATSCLTDAAPPRGAALVLDPGTAMADRAIVDSVTGTGPYQVAVNYATRHAHAAGALCRGASTADGVHPSAAVHASAASVVAAFKNLL